MWRTITWILLRSGLSGVVVHRVEEDATRLAHAVPAAVKKRRIWGGDSHHGQFGGRRGPML